jgi:hypothetical protein
LELQVLRLRRNGAIITGTIVITIVIVRGLT